jgi:hypothetical protein
MKKCIEKNVNQYFHLTYTEKNMKLICTLKTIEETFSAAAFAEENDHQSALELLRRQEPERKTVSATPINREKLRSLTPAA